VIIVHVVLTGEEGKRVKEWECSKCKWKGKISKKRINRR